MQGKVGERVGGVSSIAREIENRRGEWVDVQRNVHVDILCRVDLGSVAYCCLCSSTPLAI